MEAAVHLKTARRPARQSTDATRYALATLAEYAPTTRGDRFAKAQSRLRSKSVAKPAQKSIHKTSAFATLKALPTWAGFAKSDQHRIALVAALLQLRPLIDKELSGARLSALAGLVGEERFDAICAEKIDPTWSAKDALSTLPAPSQLLSRGQAILNAALPAGLTSNATGQDSSALAELAEVATLLVNAELGANAV
jgi:hypothetical protein